MAENFRVSFAIRPVIGSFAGFAAFVGIGAAQYVATGLNLGTVVGIDGNPARAIAPVSAWAPGLSVGLIAALLYTARSIWWDPLASRLSSAVIVVILLTIGNVIFGDYFGTFGTLSWPMSVALSAAQSMGTYAFVGVVVASSLVPARVRRDRGVESNVA
jgi:hypothetical protein